jgi:RND family efflux transporter MFP subunit
VAQAEYDRVSSLVARGATTQATLDSAQKVLLGQETAITKLRNTLALYPAQKKSLEATLTLRRAELSEAERSLEKATITAPFRGRVSAMNIETGQFVRTGDTLLSLEDISAVEITAEVQPLSFAPLIALALGDRFDAETDVDVSQAVQILAESGVTAEVGMSVAGLHPVWPAEIVRLRGTIDSETGTLGLVVRVANPMTSQRQIGRPPLNIGAFVTVTFITAPVEGSVTIPRSALHHDDNGGAFVYLADLEDRLLAQSVEVGQVLGGAVLILSGLAGGERLVLSDPRPPIIGMALDPVPVPEPMVPPVAASVEN